MDMPKETRDRIFKAADTLFADAGRDSFPTVDAVRRAARVSMGDASTAMKAWRKAQLLQSAPSSSPVPEAIEQLHRQSLASLWQAAQERAEVAHRVTRSEWEAERTEAETLNQQLADAYEEQATEVARLQERVAQGDAHRTKDATRIDGLVRQLEAMDHAVDDARAAADRAETRATEITLRATDLQKALERAHEEITQLRTEVTHATHRAEEHAHQADALRTQLASVTAVADTASQTILEQRTALNELSSERDEYRSAASMAREEAAMLRGQVTTLQDHNATLLATFKNSATPGG